MIQSIERKTLSMLFIGVVLGSCINQTKEKQEAENENIRSNQKMEKQKLENETISKSRGTNIVALIETEADGQVEYAYDFPNIAMSKPKLRKEKTGQKFYFNAGSGKYSIGMQVVIDGEGEYTSETAKAHEMSITLIRKNAEDKDDTVFKVDDKTHKGQATLRITSLSKNHITATFSATLYDPATGEEASLKNGKIDTEIQRLNMN